MTAGVEIPLFPLATVLFPGGPLPLRIFEIRYIDLVGRCLREGSGFGVVLIVEGAEAGGHATTREIGTYARIVDFSQEAGGLLGIRAVGERRFRILACRRERDGLNVAQVEWLPVERVAALPDEFAELGPLLESALGELAELYLGMERHPQDAAWVSARLAEILPVPMHHKQHCLELDDPVERIRYLRPMFEIAR